MATKDLAVLGFILSLATGGLPGLVVSAVALKKMKETGEEECKGLAIAGLVIGIVATASVVLSVGCAIIYPLMIIGCAGMAGMGMGM